MVATTLRTLPSSQGCRTNYKAAIHRAPAHLRQEGAEMEEETERVAAADRDVHPGHRGAIHHLQHLSRDQGGGDQSISAGREARMIRTQTRTMTIHPKTPWITIAIIRPQLPRTLRDCLFLRPAIRSHSFVPLLPAAPKGLIRPSEPYKALEGLIRSF